MTWRNINLDPPNQLQTWAGRILLRRFVRDPQSASKRMYDYKVLDTIIERAVSKGWNEWMEIPE